MPGTRIRPFKLKRTRKPAMIGITSAAFADHGDIPARHSGPGGNVSPPLSWSTLPEETVSLAVICEDPDARGPEEGFIHWILFDVPPTIQGLPEGITPASLERQVPGALQGVNTFGNVRYDGPAPPPGDGSHRYQFQVYALDRWLDLRPGVTILAVLDVMEGHIVGKGELVGLYRR